MEKFKLKIIAGVSAIVLLSTSAMAGSLGLGISGGAYYMETSGTETLKDTAVKTTAKEDAKAAIGAAYIQWTMADDGFVLGYEIMPGKLKLGQGSSVVSDVTNTNGTRTKYEQKAEAELKNHQTIYVETPGLFGGKNGGLYLTAGVNYVKLKTLESLGTGTSYPNENIWGARWGLGWKSIQDEGKGMVLKVLAEYNDYETVVLNGNASDGKVNKIEADPEAYGLKLSIGFNF